MSEQRLMLESSGKRKHARIESSIVCNMATATDLFEGVVANLSKSGAAIIASLTAAEVGETVTLMLERDEGLLVLSLPGTVTHKDEQDGRARYGVEFDPLPPDEESQLGLLLQLLLNDRGQGRRAHPRVSARIEVVCRTESIFRGWVSDLSRGGLSLRCIRDVPVGDPIEVSFGVRGLNRLVELACEVMSSQPVEGGFRLGLQFAPLSATEQAQVNRSLDLLLEIALPDVQIVAEDEP